MEKPRWERERERMLLLQAAIDGNLRLLRKMARALDAGRGEAAVVAAQADGASGSGAMHLAATEGRMDVLRYLVEELCLDVNKLNNRDETPLFLSAFFGRAAATRYLLDHGADPTILSKAGSPLHGAAGKGHCEIVELLLSKGIDVNLDSIFGTPLHSAATDGQHCTMKILLKHHADPNKVFGHDDTPLRMAVSSGSLECVKLLIKAGADVKFKDKTGTTYVMVAASNGLSDILKCLLDAGANPNIQDDFGTTPIEVAALQGRREIVEMLFPFTSPIARHPDWSIDGIISHMKIIGLQPMDDLFKKKILQLKLQGREAFNRKEYKVAAELYTNAVNLNPSNHDHAILLANRSLCLLHLELGEAALSDADMCRRLRPQWEKACYRQGAAFMFLKDYVKACEAFADGLKLDPTNVEIENALREAIKNGRCSEKKL